jgi:hypothetical protein
MKTSNPLGKRYNCKRRIIHKHILIKGEIRYLCNQACITNWLKTEITNKKVNCKNCLRLIAKELGAKDLFWMDDISEKEKNDN